MSPRIVPEAEALAIGVEHAETRARRGRLLARAAELRNRARNLRASAMLMCVDQDCTYSMVNGKNAPELERQAARLEAKAQAIR